jgi:hypothetical protein
VRGGVLDWVPDAKRWAVDVLHSTFRRLNRGCVAVAGSLSWRIPLGLQLFPGIILGLGTFALPASPRLLVLQGRREEALVSLAKLRLRPLSEARTDPLIQVRTHKASCICLMSCRSSSWKWKPKQQCFREQVQSTEVVLCAAKLWRGLSFLTTDTSIGRSWGYW